MAPRPSGSSSRPAINTPGSSTAYHASVPAVPRKISEVFYAGYRIECQFPSPYPFEDLPPSEGTPASAKSKGKGRAKATAGLANGTPRAGNVVVLNAPHSNGTDIPVVGSVFKAGGAGAGTGAGEGTPSRDAGSAGATKTPGSTKDPSANLKVTERLFVCDGCFKYCLLEAGFNAHKRECTFRHPPGRKVYQRGAHTIWEVDAKEAKLYCQNLCLFGKLFIEHKYQFFDLDGFLFYILTDATPSFDYPLAYFSKEKVSYDDYNLACIVTFPPFQKKNYGTLLIEFSYALTRRRGPCPGTPERPLSRLGLASYQAYWTGVLVRHFRELFARANGGGSGGGTGRGANGVAPGGAEGATPSKRRRKGGFDGELPGVSPTKPGAAAVRPAAVDCEDEDAFEVPTTLEEVAAAVNVRAEDVAFALVESGLAQWRTVAAADEMGEGGGAGGGEGRWLEVVVSPELVEQVAAERRVRPGIMQEVYVLL